MKLRQNVGDLLLFLRWWIGMTLLGVLVISPIFSFLFSIPLDEWGVDNYFRIVQDRDKIIDWVVGAAFGAGALSPVVRAVRWLDFPARFRDRMRELDPREPKP